MFPCAFGDRIPVGDPVGVPSSLIPSPALCFPGLPDQRPVDQRGSHGGGEHPADPGSGLPAEQHCPGAHAAGLGEQHWR